MLSLFITSTLNEFQTERRFAETSTVGDLKKKLELIVGASPEHMQLTLKTNDNKIVGTLSDDLATLLSLGVKDAMVIHVTDTCPSGVAQDMYNDTSKVEKFELSEEQYDQRKDTVRAWKQRNKLGQFDPNTIESKQAESEEIKAAKLAYQIDSRCEVRLTSSVPRRGCIKYVGGAHMKPGVWIGVQYDEPMGKHDGEVQGKRYFKCPPKYGSFVRPADVFVGDYPEVEFDEDMDEI